MVEKKENKKKSYPNKSKQSKSPGVLALLKGDHFEWPLGITPSGDKYCDAIALQLIIDCENPQKNYMSLAQWCIDNRIALKEFQRLRERNSTVAEAAEHAKDIIGERRERALDHGAPTIMGLVLPQYNKVWKAERDERAALKQKDSSNEPIQIIYTAVPALPTKDKE